MENKGPDDSLHMRTMHILEGTFSLDAAKIIHIRDPLETQTVKR